jgi:hypothetical protein
MILKIEIKVNSGSEAYNIVSQLGFEHNVLSADLDGVKENFSKTNQPNWFLKDNNKIDKNIFKKLI